MNDYKAIVNRALIRYFSEYFSMSPEEQLKAKLNFPEINYDNIVMFFGKEIAGDNFNECNEEHIYKRNCMKQVLLGIGPSYFSLNEFDWDEKILQYKTLYDYNEQYHNDQEEAWFEVDNSKNYVKKPLYNRLQHWARAIDDDQFYYLNLHSVATHAHWAVDEIIHQWMEDNIPHTFKDGDDHGKEDSGLFQIDIKLNAYGKEVWYDEMLNHSFNILKEIPEGEHLDGFVYSYDHSREFDPHKEYVFGGLDVLKKVSFMNFMGDCNKLLAPSNKALDEFTNQQVTLAIKSMNEKFEEVKRTVDPNVLKFKKKMKIMTDQKDLF